MDEADAVGARGGRGPADEDAPPAEVAQDEVDEASWESFPASDPPAWQQHE